MTLGRRAAACAAAVLAVAGGACTSRDPGERTAATSTTEQATVTTAAAPTTTTTVPVEAPSTSVTTPGPVVVIDPGHNGANDSHTAEINKLVDIGNGRKACNTTGTATNAGYPEHAFNWDIANRVAEHLRAAGFAVVLTRPDDNGWGPCVTERAAIANRAGAAAFVSIQADGGPASGRGFHVIMPADTKGLTDDIFESSRALGAALHTAIEEGTDMPPADYIGDRNGFDTRSDLGGLNMNDVPAVYVESGNMRNATDVELLMDDQFRDHFADALAAGIASFVRGGTG